MKKITWLLLVFIPSLLHAQQRVDGMVRAEKSFSAFAVAHNTRDAFLKFADSGGLVFEKGEPVNAIRLWSGREIRPGVLEWHPQFAEISASGDFGYTTGPWTFRAKSIEDCVVARGQFSTIWHLNKNGEWKFLLDLGNGNSPLNTADEAVELMIEKKKGSIGEVLNAEQDFIDLFKKDPSSAYGKFVSSQTILNRNGRLPATAAVVQKTIAETPAGFQLQMQGSGIATSGDLAYVYGTATLDHKSENYLHVWRNERNGWKLALEVLRY